MSSAFYHRLCLVSNGRTAPWTAPQWQWQWRRSYATSMSNNHESNLHRESDWDRACPFTEIPTQNIFRLMASFLPGGKYYKKDLTNILSDVKGDSGIFFWPKMIGRPAMVFTDNPADFEIVFRNEGVWPNRPGSEIINHHRSVHRTDFFQGVEGIISTQDKQWGSFRSIVNPVLMQPKTIRMYYNKMAEVNQKFVDKIKRIRDPETLEVPDNFEEDINCWTLESVSVVALDRQLGLLDDGHQNPHAKLLFNHLTEFFKLSFELELKPSLWKYVPTPKFNRVMKILDDIVEINYGYVNEAIERLEASKSGASKMDDSVAEDERSVLEKLLKIDKKVAVVMAMDMLMAGVDTTTVTFAATLLCLAKNPAKQAKLREEVMRVLPDKDSPFTEDSVKNYPYLQACIKEALRFYPLALGNGRVPPKDIVLSGYQIPKGTNVMMMAASLLRNDAIYPRSSEFLPERWLRSADGTSSPLKSANPFVYLPFGFGPRSCIGKRIVEMELELCVARIIRNFHVEFNHPSDDLFRYLMILMTNRPLKFKFIDV